MGLFKEAVTEKIFQIVEVEMLKVLKQGCYMEKFHKCVISKSRVSFQKIYPISLQQPESFKKFMVTEDCVFYTYAPNDHAKEPPNCCTTMLQYVSSVPLFHITCVDLMVKVGAACGIRARPAGDGLHSAESVTANSAALTTARRAHRTAEGRV